MLFNIFISFQRISPLLSEVVPKRVNIMSSSDNHLFFAKKCSSIPKLQSEIYFIRKCFIFFWGDGYLHWQIWTCRRRRYSNMPSYWAESKVRRRKALSALWTMTSALTKVGKKCAISNRKCIVPNKLKLSMG